MTFYGQIYQITYPDDPHYYIGQTCRGIHQRLQEHKRVPTGTDLWFWIENLQNLDLLRIEVLKETDQLDYFEEIIVGDLWFTDPYCLNMKPGGNSAITGSEHPNSIFTKEEANEIKTLYQESDYNTEELAVLYGVSSVTIRNLLSGKQYRDSGVSIEYSPKEKAKAKRYKIRLFAQNHQDWSGKEIADYFGINPKYGRMILRNSGNTYDPDWDPETWTYLTD